MTVERIKEAILREARQEAESILEEARSRHRERLEEAKKRLDAEFEDRFRRAAASAERESEREVMQRRAEHNMELLRRRNQILDELFSRAAELLVSLPDEEYRQVIAGWAKELPKDVGGRLLCNSRDEERLRPMLDELNQARQEDARLELVPGEAPALGGVVFTSERFEIDLSLDSRIAALRQELAPEVARFVFGEGMSI